MAARTIFCLATHAWNAHWTPVQQVMARLAGPNRVIYFEPFHPPLAWLKAGNHVLRAERHLPALREVAPNLLVYRPQAAYLPRNMRSRIAARVNGAIYKREIRQLLRQLGEKRPWLWMFFAQNLSVLDLEFEHVIYDCVDEWPAFFTNPVERQWVTEIDEALCRRADLLFVGSDPLRKRKAALNSRIVTVNHAADVPHFINASAPETIVPADLDAIPRPRVGFVGMMDEVRFDTSLIERLARDGKRQIVLIGGFIGSAERSLPDAANVHRLGMKPVKELPGYLKGLDVCLMPYRLNDATRHIYPLKLHEYLATGKPVVSTAIPAVEGLEDVIHVAHTPEQFEELVDRALLEPAGLARRRQEVAMANSWEIHVARKLEAVERYLTGEAHDSRRPAAAVR